MNISFAKKLIKVLWHDPMVGTDENQKYCDIFSNNFAHFIDLEDYEVASDYLESDSEERIIITSGLNGEKFIEKIKDLAHVRAIIVFCNNTDYHKTWMSRFPKVRAVINSGPEEVIEEIKKIYSNEITGEFLRSVQTQGSETGQLVDTMTGTQTASFSLTKNVAYFHLRQDVEMEFRAVFLIYMKSIHASTPLAEKVLQELKSLNPEESEAIEEIYNKKKDNLLEAIIYLYSTEILYNKLNDFLASGQYDKIKNITAAILQEIKKRSDLQLNLPLKENGVLYRGIWGSESILSQYKKDKRGFWPAFTSTSLKEKIARSFSGYKETERIIFRIKLSDKNPHPHILLSKELSENSRECEVLLLPYFAMIVQNIKKENGFTYVDVVQDEDTQVLSLNDEEFKKYWEKAIEQEMVPKFNSMIEEAIHETKQRLKSVKYVPREICEIVFEFLKRFWDSCPDDVVRDMLGALENNDFASALRGNLNIIALGFLEVVCKGLTQINNAVKVVLAEVFDNFKARFQSLLRSILASDYDLNSLPQLNNFNVHFNHEKIMGSLNYSLFFCKIDEKSDEQWVGIIEEQTSSPKFVSMIDSLVMIHVEETFADLKNKLLQVIKTTMGL